jgi:hypothetical protein
MSWILVESGMPNHVIAEALDLGWGRHGPYRREASRAIGEPSWNSQDQIAFGYRGNRRCKEWHRQSDFALHRRIAEGPIDQGLLTGDDGDRKVPKPLGIERAILSEHSEYVGSIRRRRTPQ